MKVYIIEDCEGVCDYSFETREAAAYWIDQSPNHRWFSSDIRELTMLVDVEGQVLENIKAVALAKLSLREKEVLGL